MRQDLDRSAGKRTLPQTRLNRIADGWPIGNSITWPTTPRRHCYPQKESHWTRLRWDHGSNVLMRCLAVGNAQSERTDAAGSEISSFSRKSGCASAFVEHGWAQQQHSIQSHDGWL
jgi:hypothetical protein